MKNLMNEKLTISESSPLKARFYDYDQFFYPWHFHSEYEIIYFREGCGTSFVGNSMTEYKTGDAILLGPDLPHYMKSELKENSRAKGTIVQFERNFMHHAISNYPHFIKIKKLLEESVNGVYFATESGDEIHQLLNRIPNEVGIDQLTTFLKILKKLSENNTRHSISTSDIFEESVFHNSRIDKIISFLNKNYNRDISLDEISSIAAMNPSAFCRYFKSKTSKSFKNYILDMRTSYACKLILMDSMNMSQISTECGFENISYFNKTFKKKTGHTPSQYKSLMLNS